MRNHSGRLAKLEKKIKPAQAGEYLCVYYQDGQNNRGQGYDAKPMTGAGEPIHFDTLAELEAFEARPGVILTRIAIVYASGQPISTIQRGDYVRRVGVDVGEL